MPQSASPITHRRFPAGKFFGASLLLLLAAFTLAADTPSPSASAQAGDCYCHCSASHARMGCVKMCELKKYASRWWAVSCAKPRIKPPADKSGAGPRLPHPDHAQYAKL
jgi:hypothetical protein